MVDRNNRIRFAGNNFTEASTTTLTVSSAQTLYPSTNLTNSQRYKHWSPEGNFVIDSTNNKLYYSDGSSQTATITSGSYTPDDLATEIDTQLTAIGGTWTVTYDAAFTFTITKSSGTFELTLSSTSNAIWDTIGHTGASDLTGALTYTSDEIRIHTEETIDWDLGVDTPVTFFALIAKRQDGFTLSSTATITLEGDSIPIGASPAFSRSLSVETDGIFEFLDDADDYTYRYWKLTIVDVDNPLGPTGLKFGVAYLGDYITLSTRGLESGFTKRQIDPSLKNTAESGAVYYKQRNRYWRFSNLSMPYLAAADRKAIEDFFYSKGNFTPFFLSLDPTLQNSTELNELTKYVRFDGDPSVVHVKGDTYSVQFNAVEDL